MSAQAARAAAAESASELSATADTPSPHPYPSEGKPMEIDLNLIPAKLDAVHVGLAAVVVVLLLVQIILLSVAVIALLRRRPEPAVTLQSSPAVSAAEPVKALEPVMKKETVVLKETTPDAALQLLTLLQKEARFIDFVQENIAHYSDAEIGAAARVVHEGCHKVIGQVFDLAPVRSETEGSRLTLPKGFDAASVRLSGNIVGEPPFTGTLVHRGWRVENIRLPKVAEGHDVRILAQAEVEL
nr:DUF2760 domain-containing protein [Methylococcus capsulatus]